MKRPLTPGDRAPNFFLPDHRGIVISLHDKVKGGQIIILFLPNLRDADAVAELDRLIELTVGFANDNAHIFVVTGAPAAALREPAERLGGHAHIVSDNAGRTAEEFGVSGLRTAYVLDANARVQARLAAADTPLARRALALVGATDWPQPQTPAMHPPILLIPNVFDAKFCRYLIDQYEARGHEESGTFRMVDGEMVHAPNHAAKRRSDHHVFDKDLLAPIQELITRRVVPEMARAFHTRISWVEEFKIVCYDARRGGYFHIHRDNTTPQTAHRRFAMTLNLNADEYEGGQLRFPEYGNAVYKPATGMAVIFSCNLLHEATPVARGKRYVLLSFMSDEAGKQQFVRYRDATRKRAAAQKGSKPS